MTRTLGEAKAILERTSVFSATGDAIDAIEEYLRRWPDSVEARDVDLTRQCLKFLAVCVELLDGKFTGAYHDVEILADAAGAGLPLWLSNGLVTAARLANNTKRIEAAKCLFAYCQMSATLPQVLYNQADREHQSLLVDGKTRAQVNKVTMEQAYRDAEVHYASYEKGALDAALRGFTHLKKLAPTDAYFRNMVGSILLRKEKQAPALQEFLYGLSLAPGDVNLTANTLRCLCGFALYPAAVEVARHHEEIGANLKEPRIQPWAALARALTAAVITKMSNCSPQDISPEAADLIDEFEVPERPWLAKPEKADNSQDLLRDARIFISYRHAGGLDYAQSLERALKGTYPSMHVFRDGTCLIAGMDFVDQIREEIDAADVFLALIDRNFSRSGKLNVSRLLDRSDILRREVARAFQEEVPIIPVLLEGAQMPREKDVPEELRNFSRLHALHLTEAGFARDFGILLETMAHLVTVKQLEEQATDKRFDEILELDKRDPDAARALIQPALDELPKFIRVISEHGEGVPDASIELAGLWECNATGPGGRMTLRFVTESTVGTPFSGEIRIAQKILGMPISKSVEEIVGTWMPVFDLKKKLTLGIYLDGLKSGEPFKLLIPFHRRLGRELVGTDAQGVTYSSRNVEPRRKGF